jgi:hypothetical protein
MEESEMMNYENGDWVQKVETELCRFLRFIRELVYAAVFVGAIVTFGYFGSQMYDEHRALVKFEGQHARPRAHKTVQKQSGDKDADGGLFKSTLPSLSPNEPVLIPMGELPSP